jgi:hypothetical protein
MSVLTVPGCPRGRACRHSTCVRAACFRAELAVTGCQPARTCRTACGIHLAEAVQALTSLARANGLTSGTVTIHAIDGSAGLVSSFPVGAFPLHAETTR